MTGEMFEFMTSARAGDGVFRFRWTLAGKKKGPPPHVHDDERETFAVVAGTLRIWLDGAPRDLRAGESVTVERGVEHRFLNPTSEPVVVDVSLDGSRQEDALVPIAYRLAGSKKMRLSDMFVFIVHGTAINASHPKGKIAQTIFSGLGRFIRMFGVKPLAPVERWH
jgi:mannose-6-phosphate isomerase-like protein (cupin superfamily)